jgi:menaquinone-dependent protoporphyrinogen oxidase
MTRITIIYASRHGATRGIATRLGEVLRERGLDTSVVEAHEAPSPATSDALVIGSALYMGKWLEPATAFVRKHRDELRRRPTWLFGSGPVGTAAVDGKGHDLLEPPKFMDDLAGSISARATKVFFGRWDPSDEPTSIAERLFQMLPLPKDAMPIGDFRDWRVIDDWAGTIADELARERVAEPVA